ncbi:hypothetical protein [Microbacterium sp. Se5.02b]|uniref:hypothetical protein n=1 Tax=Microbacterium sp. Se5.02b TaxID=2864103 RepID=UPI001C687A58|nr:hypothetical protein [Microbacterium sp. Se5.02b]QYM65551.1 hypothetical protein K1X59_07620 [Microbacterium sp. Se5.02b]
MHEIGISGALGDDTPARRMLRGSAVDMRTVVTGKSTVASCPSAERWMTSTS